ncbi:MAG: hypothetical protein ACI9XR_000104 [Flavobacterium sp.]|jgi:hypothetical protein
MKISVFVVLLFAFVLQSCQDVNENRLAEQKKEAQKKEVVFDKISQSWVFDVYYLEPQTQNKINNWMEWRMFVTEINQKPKSTIGAFQKKASILSKRVDELSATIPTEFNKANVRSRITVLTTKVKMLDLYIHLNQIPPEKVIKFIAEINKEIISFQDQLEEIVIRSEIPKEIGEPDFIKMKDTSRAIPKIVPEDNTTVFRKKGAKFVPEIK